MRIMLAALLLAIVACAKAPDPTPHGLDQAPTIEDTLQLEKNKPKGAAVVRNASQGQEEPDTGFMEVVVIGRVPKSSGGNSGWKGKFEPKDMVGTAPSPGTTLIITRCDHGGWVAYCSRHKKEP